MMVVGCKCSTSQQLAFVVWPLLYSSLWLFSFPRYSMYGLSSCLGFSVGDYTFLLEINVWMLSWICPGQLQVILVRDCRTQLLTRLSKQIWPHILLEVSRAQRTRFEVWKCSQVVKVLRKPTPQAFYGLVTVMHLSKSAVVIKSC